MIISSEKIDIEIFNPPELIQQAKDEINEAIDKFFKIFRLKNIKIDISFCSKNDIQRLNKKFRQKNQPTNVLSFPDKEMLNISKECRGEIIVCIDVLKEEAVANNKNEVHHFLHLIIHSMLHLLGYKHDIENDAILMESKEIEFLSKIGISNPYK